MEFPPYVGDQLASLVKVIDRIFETSPVSQGETRDEFLNKRLGIAGDLVNRDTLALHQGGDKPEQFLAARFSRMKGFLDTIGGDVERKVPQKSNDQTNSQAIQKAMEAAAVVGRLMAGQGVSVAAEAVTEVVLARSDNKDHKIAEQTARDAAPQGAQRK